MRALFLSQLLPIFDLIRECMIGLIDIRQISSSAYQTPLILNVLHVQFISHSACFLCGTLHSDHHIKLYGFDLRSFAFT